ncbi:MAG: hypothetical protein AB1451_16480 [Nitrospirota bacterium]
MNAVRVGWFALLGVVVAAGAWWVTNAWGAHCGGTTGKSCTENIRETKHNLAANTDILSSGTTEVCVFCHTPHGGSTNVAGGGAPLWNRALPLGTDVGSGSGQFQVYDSPNFDNQLGAELPGPKGVSLACLSCHDGTIALDALINAPGSGGFNAANRSSVSGTSTGARLDGISFTGPGVDPATESLNEGLRPSTTTGGGFAGGLNDFVGGPGMEPFPNLTRDLRDDHPISVRMPPANVDPQFADAITNSPTTTGNIRPMQRLGATLPPDKRDQIRLYNSGISSGTTVSVDWVECASCHNPHTPRTTFLRLPSLPNDPNLAVTNPADGDVTPVVGATRNLNHEPNQGSLICLTCHEK